jgi:hypothetical protein
MFIPKKYGQSQIKKCPWCQSIAVAENSQRVPVCFKHKENYFENVKCSCGKFIDLMHGKFGSFFVCINCGIISMKKALEINLLNDITKAEKSEKKKACCFSFRDKEEMNYEMLKLYRKISNNNCQTKSKIEQNKNNKEYKNCSKELSIEKLPSVYDL